MILASEAVPIPMDPNQQQPRQGDLYIDQKFVLPDGTLVGYDYFGGDGSVRRVRDAASTRWSMLVVPGERYRFVETREALALAGGSLVALLLAGFVVSRRRPG